MLDNWLSFARSLSEQRADFYSGARKILRGRRLRFDRWRDDLRIQDCGFTQSKLTTLRRHYVHEESIAAAAMLWKGRVERGKYGSVGFHCYNHYVKNNPEKRSIRASVMGPCIQAVNFTLMPRGDVEVDVFYRTTEFYKKFPADLILLRNVLLPAVIGDTVPSGVTFHFANVTMHPMYWVTILPLLDDPVEAFEDVRIVDEYFWQWMCKWTARYVCDEHHRGIAKFSQALRVQADARRRLTAVNLRKLQDYLRKNHPGYRREYIPPEMGDERIKEVESDSDED